MICRSCETAGQLNQRGIYHMEKGETRAAETAFAQSEFMHDECVTPDCYCQHRVEGR
jgi:hypothetical protein